MDGISTGFTTPALNPWRSSRLTLPDGIICYPHHTPWIRSQHGRVAVVSIRLNLFLIFLVRKEGGGGSDGFFIQRYECFFAVGIVTYLFPEVCPGLID